MVWAEGYRRAAEARKAEWEALILRFQVANLPAPEPGSFYHNRPITRTGWGQFSALLAHEGQLNERFQSEIKLGLESIDIREKEADIQERIRNGESLPDPTWPSTSPEILPEFLLAEGAMNIIRWTAIKELGLDTSGYYNSVQRRAAEEMYRIAKIRGDFRNFWENLRPEKSESSAVKQEPALPSEFVATELNIPISAFIDTKKIPKFIRYHPILGLVQGSIHSSSYYDRGAGNSPGGRGKRVTRFHPVVRSFLESVDLKKFNTLSKKSTMRILETTGTFVGLEKMDSSLDAEMHVSDWFWSQEEVERFLRGDIESAYVSNTLPVEVLNNGSSLRIRFYGKSINSFQQEYSK